MEVVCSKSKKNKNNKKIKENLKVQKKSKSIQVWRKC
jgi:hypothetical protein